MKATHLGFLGSPKYPEIFEPILEQIKKTRNFRESTTPFANYAYFCVRDKQYTKAKDIYTELFELNTGWINDIIFSFGERAFATYYNAKLKESYENFHSFVKAANEKLPALFPLLAAQAYNNLLFTKSISLKGTQRRKEAFLNANDPAINKLYDHWIEKKQQLIRQYLKTDDPGGIDTVNKINAAELKKLQSEVNQLENELTIKAKDFKKYLKIIPPDWKSVQAHLKDGEAAIEMIRFDWRNQLYYTDTSYYAAYIITKNSVSPDVVYLTDAAKDLDDKYYKLYKNSIKFKTTDNESYNHFWKRISEKLVQVSGDKRITKVYFSPDGIYHLINISTLKNPATNEYLLDELDIQYTTSGAELISSPAKDIKTATLMGRPAYRMENASATALANGETRSYVRSFRDANIPDLPGTEEEVLSIKKEMDLQKIKVNTWLKADATEDKLYKLHSPGILHIATHGYWSPAGESATDGYRVFNAMANSGLLLSGVINYYSSNVYPDTYDGILTAYEAQNLDLENTSLVILSACETSLGAMDAGEGIYGLQRAFRTAGARSIMTSLWKVDDKATKDFMITFYQHYLANNDKAAAFAAAQKAIRTKYIYPYFWGAFVMMGE
jgi:CHAT domain-containing protein